MSDLTINIPSYDDPAALLQPDSDLTAYHQEIKLRLRPQERSVSVEILRAVVLDSTPMEIYHGREYRLAVDPQIDATQLRSWVKSHSELIERIFDGHSVKFDGKNQIGRLTTDASVAKDRLEAMLAKGKRHPSFDLREPFTGELPDFDFDTVGGEVVRVPTHTLQLMDAGQWIAPAEDEIIDEFKLSEDTTDERLAEVARKLNEEARTEAEVKLHGTEEYLRGLFETTSIR